MESPDQLLDHLQSQRRHKQPGKPSLYNVESSTINLADRPAQVTPSQVGHRPAAFPLVRRETRSSPQAGRRSPTTSPMIWQAA
ncbi:MAG: hypothetical protein R2912_00785 [Eubacteriales bacterium]